MTFGRPPARNAKVCQNEARFEKNLCVPTGLRTGTVWGARKRLLPQPLVLGRQTTQPLLPPTDLAAKALSCLVNGPNRARPPFATVKVLSYPHTLAQHSRYHGTCKNAFWLPWDLQGRSGARMMYVSRCHGTCKGARVRL